MTKKVIYNITEKTKDWKIVRWKREDAERIKKKLNKLMKDKGIDIARASLLKLLKEPSNIVLFGYLVLPHYFFIDFEEVHYETLKFYEIGKRRKNHKGLMAYREHGKTTMLITLGLIYEICFDVFKFIILNSYTKTMAKDKLKLLKDEFETNEVIRFLFGDPIYDKEYWKAEDISVFGRCRVKALSTMENPRGMLDRGTRPDLVISDDILDDHNVRSEEQRDKALEWYKRALSKAIRTDGVQIIINSPLHRDDIISTVFSNEKNYFTSWDKRKVDAMVNGKSVCEAWKTTEQLLQEKEDDPAVFMQERMNTPSNVGKGIIKFEHLRFYDDLFDTSIKSVYIHADTTHTAKTTSDFFACGILGQCEKTNKIYLIDFIIDRIDVDEQINYMIGLFERYSQDYTVEKMTFDEKSNQGFEMHCKKEALRRNIFLPLEPLGFPRDKVTHFTPHIPKFKSNSVFFPIKHEYKKRLIDQLTSFPDKSINDDAVDMLSGLLDNFDGVNVIEDYFEYIV